MSTLTLDPVSLRQKEIINNYIALLDLHIAELKSGTAERTLEIKDFAEKLHIHPTHLSNTIHEVLGKSPCDLYEHKLVNLSKELLSTTTLSIAQIARQLYYDPSNFTKFFKRFEHITPKEYRNANFRI
jgi:AraC family transcriptional regulator, regulatory protein of adaptative response / methylphosphotriester-DNA alkyltransferase methyltransferase